ncbi:MAG: acyl-phosphate glycerol 3-phosphate acyltransferase [Planctomycetes bacterium TMED75]|nr:acyl-phosphate glycerol 3-phosphate acyltransferase [Planctomycetaceae bacterium]OUU94343.1 MAG: acyl-phosphate glycerol 3-phosphate acyltransferase [Planctomycetes bacterium TMED75]
MTPTGWLLWCLIAFVFGSIPFGVLLAKLKKIDLRTVGSGNTGATNVGRALGRRWGILCFVLDAAKGATPVLLAGLLAKTLGEPVSALAPSEASGWLAVGVAAILGHVFSPFLNFKGGKGVATACGALLAMWPLMTIPVLVAAGVFILMILSLRIMSLASMAAAIAIPAMTLILGLAGESAQAQSGSVLPQTITGLVIAFMVVWRHRSNLKRILDGTEPKLFGADRTPRDG